MDRIEIEKRTTEGGRTSAIRSDKKTTITGIESEGEIFNERNWTRRRMAVDPWVGELELIDNHHWITIISLIVIDPHYSSSIKEFRKE